MLKRPRLKARGTRSGVRALERHTQFRCDTRAEMQRLVPYDDDDDDMMMLRALKELNQLDSVFDNVWLAAIRAALCRDGMLATCGLC